MTMSPRHRGYWSVLALVLLGGQRLDVGSDRDGIGDHLCGQEEFGQSAGGEMAIPESVYFSRLRWPRARSLFGSLEGGGGSGERKMEIGIYTAANCRNICAQASDARLGLEYLCVSCFDAVIQIISIGAARLPS